METCMKLRSGRGPKATNLDRANTPSSTSTTSTMPSQTHIRMVMKRRSTK
jgi:hypothetical protein